MLDKLEHSTVNNFDTSCHHKIADRLPESFHGMVGDSPSMRRLFEEILLVSQSHVTVLVVGESGTGKELVARAIHDLGPRVDKPYLPINCAAISDSLAESELFGHEKGAFTGANTRKEGFFQAARGGTIVIDEIGELPMGLQSKFLRVIENRTVIPVGSTKETTVDVRLIGATHRDLAEEVDNGRFREDLFYRLNVVQLHVPALRERPTDILPLFHHFMNMFSSADNKSDYPRLSQAASIALESFAWPGNVRQLKNIAENLYVMKKKAIIELTDLPNSIQSPSGLSSSENGMTKSTPEAVDCIDGKSLAELERRAILKALESQAGSRTMTARVLGISVRTLQRKLKQMGIN